MNGDDRIKPEIIFEDGIPLPPSEKPVIILQGSDYEIGYQYFYQAVQIFGTWVSTHFSIIGSPTQEAGVWVTAELKSRQYSETELNELHEYDQYIKRFAPEFIDIYKGMAAAATDLGIPLSYYDILRRFSHLPYVDPQATLIESLSGNDHGGCSGFAAWGKATKDGKLIVSASGDAQGGYFSTTVVVFPETGNNFVISPESTLGLGLRTIHPAMNNKGLVFVHHGAGNPVDGKPGYGVPTGIATFHTLRFANNAAEAEALQLAYPLGCKAGGLWVDVKGNAFCIECRYPKAIRRPGDCGENDFIYVANNRLCRELDRSAGDTYLPHAGWIGSKNTSKDSISREIYSVPRNLQMYDTLTKHHGKVDLEFVKAMWRVHGNPPSYANLEEAIATYNVSGGKGWDVKISNLHNSIVAIGLPDEGDEGLYYVCSSSAARIAHPGNPIGFRYSIAPSYAFYQLKLASNPEKVAIAARTRAQSDLYHANTELRKLNYLNNGYAALDEILNEALKEWFKGEYVLGMAFSNKENAKECLYHYSKSVRCYTRCQTLAQKVYDALVSPTISLE
jgi:hypothetical protein